MKKSFLSILKILHLFIILFLTSSFCLSQTGKQIEIINADFARGNKLIDPDLRKLIGNVILMHNFTLMYCDSAYYYISEDRFKAFGEIKIEQGDSLYMTCDSLDYNGNTDMAKARQNVILINKDITLYTNYLDYNTKTSSGYYFNGGKIINNETNLTSERGNYFAKDDIFHFKKDVIVTNPKYNINSDTLKYNTETKTVFFLGPSVINNEENYIYCEYGYYNTLDSISQFEKNAFVKNDEQIVYGDLLYFDNKTSTGKGRNNVTLYDYKQDVIAKGNKFDFNRNTDEFTLTDSAVVIMIDETDSIFIHADTIKSLIDTTKSKKNRLIKAYYKTKFFRRDLQGKCDSMIYSSNDSLIKLYREPVIWSGANQMTAKYVEVQLKNNQFDKIFLKTNAFIISEEDTSKYNQIKGKNMIGYFKENQIYLIDVDGNGQMIYFAKNENDYIGMNKVECSNLKLNIENRKIKSVNSITKPVAKLTPIELINREDMKLKGFVWFENYRPVSKFDIFRWE